MNAVVYELNLIRLALQFQAMAIGIGMLIYIVVEALKANRR